MRGEAAQVGAAAAAARRPSPVTAGQRWQRSARCQWSLFNPVWHQVSRRREAVSPIQVAPGLDFEMREAVSMCYNTVRHE